MCIKEDKEEGMNGGENIGYGHSVTCNHFTGKKKKRIQRKGKVKLKRIHHNKYEKMRQTNIKEVSSE